MAEDKRGVYIDLEEARRKRAREAEQRRYPGMPPREEPAETGEEEIRLGWSDILAMIIATYQILLPVVGVIIVVLIGVYFLFRLLFH